MKTRGIGAGHIRCKSTHDVPLALNYLPVHTSGAAPFVSLALLAVLATGTPSPARSRWAQGLCFPGEATRPPRKPGLWGCLSRGPRKPGPRDCRAGVPAEVSALSALPAPWPSPDCLPHYWKPLCSHCVGAVISEVPGVILRSLLESNPLARSDHSPRCRLWQSGHHARASDPQDWPGVPQALLPTDLGWLLPGAPLAKLMATEKENPAVRISTKEGAAST